MAMEIDIVGIVLLSLIGGLVGWVALNLIRNFFVLACRGLAPIVGYGQERAFKWLPAPSYWLSVVVFLLLASVAQPSFGPPTKARNSGVQGNAHAVQMALEQYAVDHSGRFPGSLRELFPTYLPGYPRTPWNTQQAATADIPAVFTTSDDDWKRLPLGRGAAEAPQRVMHFGAIGYARLGENGQHYVLSGTGQRGDDAVIVYSLSNVDAPVTTARPVLSEWAQKVLSNPHLSGKTSGQPSKR